MTRDEQLKASIEEALNNHFPSGNFGINIQVEKGYVKLHGMVETLAEKEGVTKIVNKLPDVKGVDNGLTVTMDNYTNDEEINHMLTEKLMNERKLDAKKIGANCEKGVVILRGQTSSLGEVELARELAAEVPGVREVKSLVKHTNEAKVLDDASIVNAVEVAFSVSRMVEAEDIETSCSKGTVKLEGTVDDNEQKEAAEIVAKTVPGVFKVVNNLDTRHDNPDGDEYLTNKLRRRLNQDRRVSSAQVKVYVIKGIAFLSGKVYSIEAKKAAEEVAKELKGIEQVMNDITVAYH